MYMRLLNQLYEKVFTSRVDTANPKEVFKLNRRILIILYEEGPTISYSELKSKLRHRFKKDYADKPIQDAVYNSDYMTHTAEGHVIKSISIKKEGVDFLGNEKETHVRNVREWGMLLAAIALVIVTMGIQKYTSDQTLEQQRDFYGAHLSFWQDDRVQPMSATDLISLNENNHQSLGFCLQNTGQSSTGMVSVSQNNTNNTFLVYTQSSSSGYYHFVSPNILPGEGNCTDIYIWYYDCWLQRYDNKRYCNLSLVPKGKQTIQFNRYCALCPEKDRNTIENFTFCIQPSPECA